MDEDITSAVMVSFEGERRRRYIAQARERNDQAKLALDEDITARFFTRPIEHPNDRDRREIAERDARWARDRDRTADAADRLVTATTAVIEHEVDKRLLPLARATSRAVEASERETERQRGEIERLRSLLITTNEQIVRLCTMVEASDTSTRSSSTRTRSPRKAAPPAIDLTARRH